VSHPIRIIHGPNLNLLGSRNPEVYGSATLEEINGLIAAKAATLGLEALFFQSNHEGDLIDMVQTSIASTRGLLINPGGYTHTSVALADALETYPHPCIEVHLSNIYSREEFRRHSYMSPHVSGVICGFGVNSYLLALEALHELITASQISR
jgi:3-dehydroquinate dehydratase II